LRKQTVFISFLPLVTTVTEVVTIDLHYMTDRQERFDLKISELKILRKQRHLHLGCPWGKLKIDFKVNYPFNGNWMLFPSSGVSFCIQDLVLGMQESSTPSIRIRRTVAKHITGLKHNSLIATLMVPSSTLKHLSI